MVKKHDQDTGKKAEDLKERALRYHAFYCGKIQVALKCPVRSLSDLAIWYTPGVAAVSEAIKQDAEAVFTYTNRGNTIAVVSDGTRVLGLGDIDPLGALPVMEGKALLFKYLGGVDAVPIVLNTKDQEEIVRILKILEPSFGGINLEDIESPKCFYLLDKLRETLEVPVWHDDQQGTATVTVAGLMNALKIVNKKMNEVVIALIGAGAANIAIARLLVKAGADPKKMRVVDSKGILHPAREDIEKLKKTNPWKYNLAMTTNKEGIQGGIPEAMKGADVVIAASRPGPGVIKPEWVKTMASDPIVFAEANPVPEIWPWEAKEAGAKVVATGRSDFPNQVNNSLGFPAIFRGALDVMAKTITDEMCIAAAEALAKYAEEKGLHEDYIIPTMEETECFIHEAVAVGLKAIEQGIARRKLSKDELYELARKKITESQKMLKLMMDNRLIPPPPE